MFADKPSVLRNIYIYIYILRSSRLKRDMLLDIILRLTRTVHNDHILDSRVITIQLPSGEGKDVGYNVLVNHLFSQLESEGE